MKDFQAALNLTLRSVLLDLNGQVGTYLSRGALPTTSFFDANDQLVDSCMNELSRATLIERLAKFTNSVSSPSTHHYHENYASS